MRDLTALLALPASLLSSIVISAVDAQALQWPHNLPRTIKYHPEHQPHVKRHEEAQSRLAQQSPIGVRKMSNDHGEKFFLHYWGFEEQEGMPSDSGSRGILHNETMSDSLRRPIIPHSNHDRRPRSLFRRGIFGRDFDCPANTNSCASIGYEDLCCSQGESCVETSAGVGCCPEGQTCGDSISDCDSSQGYTQCDTDDNGGCCVPGAECESGGCVFYGTQTVFTTLPTSRVTSGVGTTIETSSGREITVIYTSVESSLYTTTETVTATPEGYTTTRTIVAGGGNNDGTSETTPTPCATGFFSCPASLGGGCCPSGQACATDDLCPDTTTAAGAPILPTTDTDTPVSAATITSSSPTTTAATDSCPMGFYMCSARYLGGCCRVDRNCDTTSCPPQDTTTVIQGSDATVEAATTGAGSCANGWQLCPSGSGGGCCPSGYTCGQQSCSASGQENTGKQAPNGGSKYDGMVLASIWVIFGLVCGAGMVLL